MKKILASLLALMSIAGSSQAQKTQTIDPNSILFTTPTLSNDLAPLEPVTGQPGRADLLFHEDDWSQVEFFQSNRLPEIKRLLKELKAFEQAHRARYGWRQVFVRRIERTAVISGSQPIQQLEQRLGVKKGPAPVLLSSGSVSGRVKDGFSLPLGGNVTLYGYATPTGIPILGASVGEKPEDIKLTEAFTKLNASHKLVLVDWRSQVVLVSVNGQGKIDIWKP